MYVHYVYDSSDFMLKNWKWSCTFLLFKQMLRQL